MTAELVLWLTVIAGWVLLLIGFTVIVEAVEHWWQQ